MKRTKPERFKKLEERVWDNLHSSGLLKQILEKSAHADEESNYTGVKLWTEIGGCEMWLQVYIEHKDHSQSVTPKLYRISKDEAEQRRLSAQIWDGITEEDILYLASVRAEDYHERDQKNWLGNVEQSDSIKVFYPAIKSGNVEVELIPKFAQYKISIKGRK